MLQDLWLKGIEDITKVVMKEVNISVAGSDGSIKRIKN